MPDPGLGTANEDQVYLFMQLLRCQDANLEAYQASSEDLTKSLAITSSLVAQPRILVAAWATMGVYAHSCGSELIQIFSIYSSIQLDGLNYVIAPILYHCPDALTHYLQGASPAACGSHRYCHVRQWSKHIRGLLRDSNMEKSL